MTRTFRSFLDPRLTGAAIIDRLSHAVTPVVAPIHVSLIAKHNPNVIAAISYPHGARSKPVIKAIEATSSLKDGAIGVWIVPSWPVDDARVESLRDELLEIARGVRATRREAMIGVIVDRSWLIDPNRAVTIHRSILHGAADAIVLTGERTSNLLPFSDGLAIIEDVADLRLIDAAIV